jgi:hypothetical protein
MKHEGFQPEEEYRLLALEQRGKVEFRESGQRVVPFLDVLLVPTPQSLHVERVIVGPGWQIASLPGTQQANHHVTLGIRKLLSARKCNLDVRPSSIPYDPR